MATDRADIKKLQAKLDQALKEIAELRKELAERKPARDESYFRWINRLNAQ
jgi:peptidoglycan hydrolase CwlO-like protein